MTRHLPGHGEISRLGRSCVDGQTQAFPLLSLFLPDHFSWPIPTSAP
jgi:hypothetical protein